MEIGKKEVLQIFNRNFPFEVKETDFGETIKIPSREAFIFSAVTGAGYLTNSVLPFSPKGLLKLFYNAFDYKFVTGIFENTSLKNTPFNLSIAKPFLFESEFKYIVPIEFESEAELQKLLRSKFSDLERPSDYIILRIEKMKRGNGMESFMEYLTAEFFRKKGFVVENQIPLAHALGSPDFGGYSISEILPNVQNYLDIGFHIIELAMIRLTTVYSKEKQFEIKIDGSEIVGEAKTGTKTMTVQLLKYLNTGLFDFGFEIHPSKLEPSNNFFGLLTLDNNMEVVFIEPKNKFISKNSLSKREYQNWLKNYMKFYLIANFTNDEFNEFYKFNNNKPISSQKDIINFVLNTTTIEILNKLKEVI